MNRREKDQQVVARNLPSNTYFIQHKGLDIWIFKKNTEFLVSFEIAIYYDPDERGYCARVISPRIEDHLKGAHVGHIFSDGVICMGFDAPSQRSRHTLLEAYAKACLWAEGMAVMIQKYQLGTPVPFPFSNNNTTDDSGSIWR